MSELIEPTDVDTPLERLRSGSVFVELCNDRLEARVAMLEALLARIAGDGTKLVWIGNPLRSPLTIERLFLQAAGAEADLRVERSASELAEMLRRSAEPAARSLLIVQQPETLDAEARDTIARIAPLLAGQSPTVQFLFCCTGAFRPIPPVAPARTLPVLSSLPDDEKFEPRNSVREKLPLLLLLLAAALGALLTSSGVNPTGPPAKSLQVSGVSAPDLAAASERVAETTTPETAPVQEPADAIPAPPLSSPAAAAQIAPQARASAPPRTDVAALRREFDVFLAQQPRLSSLNQEQRDTLFDEFLQRRDKRNGQKPGGVNPL